MSESNKKDKKPRKERKPKDPTKPKRKPTAFAEFVKEHKGTSIVDGVDYKGKPKDKMKALGKKWKDCKK